MAFIQVLEYVFFCEFMLNGLTTVNIDIDQ